MTGKIEQFPIDVLQQRASRLKNMIAIAKARVATCRRMLEIDNPIALDLSFTGGGLLSEKLSVETILIAHLPTRLQEAVQDILQFQFDNATAAGLQWGIELEQLNRQLQANGLVDNRPDA
jgi:hypothetical protein